MTQIVRVLGLIPARSGSKRLAGKNLADFGGVPLVTHAARVATEASLLTDVIVSTDERELADAAAAGGAQVHFLRPKSLALDDSSSESVALHAVEFLERELQRTYEMICLLQPTSPLRTAAHIDAAITLLASRSDASSLVSVRRLRIKLGWVKTIDEAGYLRAWASGGPELDRADLFVPNGAVYIAKTRALREGQSFYTARTIPYVMEESDSVDIDEEEDLKFARRIFDAMPR